MSGYSSKPLSEKLGIKAGMACLFIDVPREGINGLPVELGSLQEGSYDFIHIFMKDPEELERAFIRLPAKLKKTGMLWVSWPKKSSQIPTGLDENTIRKAGLSAGLVDVKVCAVDDNWSGLKFVYRLSDR